MHTPYTTNFVDSFDAVQTSIGIVVSALVWHQRGRPLASRIAMQAAVVLALITPTLGELEAGIGLHPKPDAFTTLLHTVALLTTVGALLGGRTGPFVWALAGEAVLYFLTGYLTDSNMELVSLHTAWIGLVVGLHRGPNVRVAHRVVPEVGRWYASDWALFAAATTLAAIVGRVVLQRMIGSSDEWAYTYQAAVFAKFRAYAAEPGCTSAFQNFWVFPYMGRQFSQYTPGWPYFMVPFVWLGVPWLAGSFSLGLVVVGFARLGRRTMALADDGTATTREVHAAGVFAALAAALSSTYLINGGSRFPHLFVVANFVWAIEALLHLASPWSKPSQPLRWAAVLGVCAALLLAIRPVDGAGLGVGLFVYYVYALARRRLSAKSVLVTAAAFTFVGGLTLVILRLQLGKWFATGYALNPIIHPWNKFELIKPKPDEWRWGFPLATGSYGWWPCSLAVGFAGLASLGRRGRWLNIVMLLSLAPVLIFYAYMNLSRGYDWGYGPRYQMVATVPMALGTGVVFARFFGTAVARRTARSAFVSGGPLAVAVVATFLCLFRTAPLVFPFNYNAVFNQNRLNRAIQAADIHHAVVLAAPGTAGVDALDLTQNLPLDLYPNQDVIVAITRTPALERCVRDHYPDRAMYRASGAQQVSIHREN
ncbi:MAG TPA: hypothetical protein VLM85_27735 [Polyangiaceae bacterium]|nr:hypothetical protein [Polyangiaceae bacterium]